MTAVENTSTPILSEQELKDSKVVLLVHAARLTFAVYHEPFRKWLDIRSFTFDPSPDHSTLIKKIKSILAKESLLQHKSLSKILLWFDPRSTLIPDQFNSSASLDAVCDLNFRQSLNEVSVSESCPGLKAVNGYCISKDLRAFFEETMSVQSIHHSSTVWLSWILGASAELEKAVFANIQGDYLEVSGTSKGVIQFRNIFKVNSKEDLAYFTLLAYQSLNFEPNEDPLILSGEIDEDDKETTFLKEYFSNVGFAPEPENTHFGAAFQDIAPHYFISLTASQLCEL